MIYDITVYRFDRSENTMKDGDHYTEIAMSATEAVLGFIRKMAAYEDGTCGHREYASITEIDCGDDELSVSAYRADDKTWEVHIYAGTIDEAFTFNA